MILKKNVCNLDVFFSSEKLKQRIFPFKFFFGIEAQVCLNFDHFRFKFKETKQKLTKSIDVAKNVRNDHFRYNCKTNKQRSKNAIFVYLGRSKIGCTSTAWFRLTYHLSRVCKSSRIDFFQCFLVNNACFRKYSLSEISYFSISSIFDLFQGLFRAKNGRKQRFQYHPQKEYLNWTKFYKNI